MYYLNLNLNNLFLKVFSRKILLVSLIPSIFSVGYSQTFSCQELIEFSVSNTNSIASRISRTNQWQGINSRSYNDINDDYLSKKKLREFGEDVTIETEELAFRTSGEFNGKLFYQKIQVYHPLVGNDLNFIIWVSNSEFIYNQYINELDKSSDVSLSKSMTGYISDFLGFYSNKLSIRQLRNTYFISISNKYNYEFKFILIPIPLIEKIHTYHEEKVFDQSTKTVEQTREYINKQNDSKYLELAKTKLHDLSYNRLISNSLTIDKIEEFLIEFPNSDNREVLLELKTNLNFKNSMNLVDISDIDNSIKENSFNEEQITKLESRKLELIFNNTIILKDISSIILIIENNKFNQDQISKLNYRIDNLKLNRLVDKLNYFTIYSTDVLNTNYFREVDEIKEEFLKLKHLGSEKYILQLKENVYNYTLNVMKNHDVCEAGDGFLEKFPNYKTNYINDTKKFCIDKRRNLILKDSFLSTIYKIKLPYDASDADRVLDMLNQLEVLKPSIINENIINLKFKWISVKEFHEYKMDTTFLISKEFNNDNQTINKWIINSLEENKSKMVNKNFTGSFDFFISSNQEIKLDFFGNKKENKTIFNILKSNKSKLNNQLNINKWGNPVNATSNYIFDYKNTTNELKLLFDKGKFTYYRDEMNQVSYNRAQNFLEESNRNWQRGIYTFEDENININNYENNELRVLKYKSFSGISATIPAIILPNVGINKVTGKKNHGWVSMLFWGLAGSAAYYYLEAENNYSDYKNSSNQSEMDEYYSSYTSNLATSRILSLSAIGVNGISLVYVFSKGLSNMSKSRKYTKKYKSLTFKLN